MPTYDFKALSAQDFEELVCDLMERELELPLQIFSKGRDRGIDLRHSFAGARASIVMQCKHYAGSTIGQLISDAKKERVKLTALNSPKLRYYFVTSRPLSENAVAKLEKIFSPHTESAHQIIGCENLNRLLVKYPDIETKHFKLWLTSAAVLTRVIHARLETLKFMTLEEIRGAYQRFVTIPAFSDALLKLESHGHVILTGIPGAGKTTLAHVLVAKYIEKGYEAISLSGSLNELLETLNSDPEQQKIILYDDFLGESALQIKIDAESSGLLERVLNSLKKRPNLRLVFTTREYILVKAQELSERLARLDETSVLIKSVISLSRLTLQQKARIFYNHLFYSELPQPYIEELVRSKSYNFVCAHANFNPRLVEWVCNSQLVSKMQPADYVNYVRDSFNNPSMLWNHAFNQQLDDECRLICFLLLSFGGTERLEVLMFAFNAAMSADKRSVSDHQFSHALRVLEGTFVITGMLREIKVVGAAFHNPSVKDFLASCLQKSPLTLGKLLRNCCFFSQLYFLFDYVNAENERCYREMLRDNRDVVIERAYALASDHLERARPTSLDIGGNETIMTSRVTLLERAENLLEFHAGMDVSVSDIQLNHLCNMVKDADASSIDHLVADCGSLISMVAYAEQKGLLTESSLFETVYIKSFDSATNELSIPVLSSLARIIKIADTRKIGVPSIFSRHIFEDFFYELDRFYFNDADEVDSVLEILEEFEIIFSSSIYAVREHLEKIKNSFPDEESKVPRPSPPIGEAPSVLEDRFDIESAFLSLVANS